jgi:Na+/H+ antiporter NhaD/arsenite permease-like protein
LGPTRTEGGDGSSRGISRRRPLPVLERSLPPVAYLPFLVSGVRGGRDRTNLVALVLVVCVFAGVIARQLMGRGPAIWTIFLGGSFLTVATGVLTVEGAELALAAAAPVVLFLFALFLFAGALERAGALHHLASWIIGRARRAEDLPAVLFIGFGLVSAFLVNDALVLIGVPLLISVASRIRADPKPLLLVLAFAVTVGSTLTPFGNPQNLLISIGSGLGDPIAVFLRYLLVPTLLNLAVGAWYLRRVFASSMVSREAEFARVQADAPPLFPTGGWRERLARAPVLWVFPGTMLVMITIDIMAALTQGPVVPIWETAGAGAIVLLLISSGRAQMFGRVDWTILILFGGLFVVVGGAVAGGLLSTAENLLPIPGPGHATNALVAIVGTSIVAPQLVSNVPWVALQIPLLTGLGYGSGTPIPWVALAAASTLAGNVTLLGAASNLIVADLAERDRIPFRLGSFVRYGLPLAAITLGIVVLCLYLGL